jgi:PKD repeat protein
MEMCASLLSWGMLRPDQAGAQTTQNDVVAYYEALPNEAVARGPVTFDAGGTYQYLDKDARTFVADSQLEYKWEFGDGTEGTGKTVEHAYDVAGTYTSKLTVRNTSNGATDTMSVPITVVGASQKGPELSAPAEDVDGNFDVTWKFDEKAGPGFKRYVLEEATDVRRAFNDPAENLGAGWTASDPTEPTLQKWQPPTRRPTASAATRSTAASARSGAA